MTAFVELVVFVLSLVVMAIHMSVVRTCMGARADVRTGSVECVRRGLYDLNLVLVIVMHQCGRHLGLVLPVFKRGPRRTLQLHRA